MTVNMLATQFGTNFAGLGSNQSSSFSVAVPSQALAANAGVIYTAQFSLTKSTSISDVQVRYTGRDTLWYWVDGFQTFTDPAASAFSIATRVFINAGVLNVKNFIIDNTGAPQTLPAFTVDCRAFFYDAPF